jgi:hypothetical protein
MNDAEYLDHLMSGARAHGATSGREAAEMMVAQGYLMRTPEGRYRITDAGRAAVDKVHAETEAGR